MPKKPPTPPTPELLARIERELTPDLYARVFAWAEHRAAGVQSLEGRSDPQYAMGVVLDAIADTLDGICVWDAMRRPLRYHLLRVVNWRMSHDLQRARRRHHVAYHEPDDDDGAESAAEMEMSLRRDDERTRPEGTLALVELRHRVYQGLRELAVNDADVFALLDAYEAGCHDRAEVMERTGWSLGTFVNHRRRLTRLLSRLPEDLRTAALEAVSRGPALPRMETP